MTPTSDEEQALGSMKAAPSPPEPKEPVTSDSDSKKAAPPQKKKAATPKENREVNPRYKDVKETGKWGDISTSEIYVAVGIGILVIIGITLGLVFGIDNNNEPQVRTRTPEIVSPEVKLFLAFEAINVSEFTYLLQQDLSTNVADYEGLWQDSSASPQERAMSWLLFEDVDWNSREEIGERWALASIYYALGGDDWTTATNWLSSEPVCEWDHINCDSFLNTIDEIDLSNNNLVGTIPNEFVMFNATQSLWLRENSLTGPVPNEAFGSMPRLSILYLDNNKLTGTISSEIRNNGVLSKSIPWLESSFALGISILLPTTSTDNLLTSWFLLFFLFVSNRFSVYSGQRLDGRMAPHLLSILGRSATTDCPKGFGLQRSPVSARVLL